MSSGLPFCPGVPRNKKRNVRNYYNTQQLDDIDKRILQLRRRLGAGKQAVEAASKQAAETAENLAFHRMANVQKLARAVTVNPNASTRSLQHMLARDFAVWRRHLFSEAPSESGMVRQFLIRAKRLWEGSISETLAKMDTAEKLAELQKNVKHLQRKYNVSQSDWDEIQTLAVEIGWHPYLQEYVGVGAAGLEVLAGTQRNYVKRLRDMGMSQQDINTLTNAGKQVAQTYHEVLGIAQKAGLNFGEVEGMGYIPRIFSEEVLRRFAWTREADGGIFYNDGTRGSLQSAFMKSRSTHRFVVEDEVLLDFTLRSKNENLFDDLSKKFGTKIENVRDLIDDSKVLTHALANEIDAELLDNLVDSGVLSKIPMNSVEVYEMLKTRYRLPSEQLSEVMAVDWRRGYSMYRTQLEELAGKSAMTWAMVRNAIDGGWGITAAQRNADSRFKNFVPLFGTNGAIPESVAQRFGLSEAARRSLDAHNLYVHPIVADLYKSVVGISTNPNLLGVVGHVLDTMFSVFRTTAIATTSFIGTQLVNQIFQLHAARGNILDYLPTLVKEFTATSTGLRRALDNTQKLYGGLTELELYYEGMKRGLLNDITPYVGKRVGNAYHSFSPVNIVRQAKWLANTVNEYGDWRNLVEELGGITKYALSDVAGYPFHFFNNHLENAARFTALKSLMREGDDIGAAVNGAMQALSGGKPAHIQTIDDATDFIKNYFYMYDDIGKADEFIGRYVVPFWMFQSRNLPAQIRDAIRHPSRFVAFNRLYAAMNVPVYNEGEDFPEGAVPPWLAHSRPVYWKRQNDRGETEYFALPMVSLDPMADAQEKTLGGIDAMLRAFGIWNTPPRSSKEQIDELPWMETKTNTWLAKILEESYPHYLGIVGTITGKDVKTGRLLRDTEFDNTSFLGVPMSPLARYWIETTLPPLGNLNRWNPGNVFGLREQRDARTGAVTRPALPSWMGADRSDFDRDLPRIIEAARWVGLKFQHVDVAYNMGRTENDIKFALIDGRKYLKRLRETYQGKPSEELATKINDTMIMLTALQIDYQKIYDWRTARGYLPQQALQQMQRRGIDINTLPLDEEKQEQITRTLERVTRPSGSLTRIEEGLENGN